MGPDAQQPRATRRPLVLEGIEVCQNLMGQPVVATDFPGGEDRRSFRARLGDGTSVILTKRGSAWRTRKEVQVLSALATDDAPVPCLLASDGRWIIQQALEGRRLSEALAEADEPAAERLLGQALASLAELQSRGNESPALANLAPLGATASWVDKLIATPERLGHLCNMPPPSLDGKALGRQLANRHVRFVKWDARPANAIVCDGRIAWFDWEHCGRRNPLDDVVWLMGDEYTPDSAPMEDRLLDEHLPNFTTAGGTNEADYFWCMGVFHVSYRLWLILNEKKTGPWWPVDDCLRNDHVGVFEAAFQRQCRRGGRWAARTEFLKPLSDWFDAVRQAV